MYALFAHALWIEGRIPLFFPLSSVFSTVPLPLTVQLAGIGAMVSQTATSTPLPSFSILVKYVLSGCRMNILLSSVYSKTVVIKTVLYDSGSQNVFYVETVGALDRYHLLFFAL